MTYDEAVEDALEKHPECGYGDWAMGMAFPFTLTIVVKLWRTEECCLAGEPPMHTVEGYYR